MILTRSLQIIFSRRTSAPLASAPFGFNVKNFSRRFKSRIDERKGRILIDKSTASSAHLIFKPNSLFPSRLFLETHPKPKVRTMMLSWIPRFDHLLFSPVPLSPPLRMNRPQVHPLTPDALVIMFAFTKIKTFIAGSTLRIVTEPVAGCFRSGMNKNIRNQQFLFFFSEKEKSINSS